MKGKVDIWTTMLYYDLEEGLLTQPMHVTPVFTEKLGASLPKSLCMRC